MLCETDFAATATSEQRAAIVRDMLRTSSSVANAHRIAFGTPADIGLPFDPFAILIELSFPAHEDAIEAHTELRQLIEPCDALNLGIAGAKVVVGVPRILYSAPGTG